MASVVVLPDSAGATMVLRGTRRLRPQGGRVAPGANRSAGKAIRAEIIGSFIREYLRGVGLRPTVTHRRHCVKRLSDVRRVPAKANVQIVPPEWAYRPSGPARRSSVRPDEGLWLASCTDNSRPEWKRSSAGRRPAHGVSGRELLWRLRGFPGVGGRACSGRGGSVRRRSGAQCPAGTGRLPPGVPRPLSARFRRVGHSP